MTEERWDEIKRMVFEKFEHQEVVVQELVEGGFSETLEFTSPLGRVQLEFTHKPRLLDTKTLYSNRIGSGVKVERTYSQDEFVNTLKAYQYNVSTGDWDQIDSSGFLGT